MARAKVAEYAPPPCLCCVCGARVETETFGYVYRITYPAGRAYWEVYHPGCVLPVRAGRR